MCFAPLWTEMFPFVCLLHEFAVAGDSRQSSLIHSFAESFQSGIESSWAYQQCTSMCQAQSIVVQAMEDGMSQETIFEYTKIDPWFLSQLGELHEAELWLKTQSLDSISYDDLLATKQRGFSDVQIARCMGKASPPPCFSPCLVFCMLHATTLPCVLMIPMGSNTYSLLGQCHVTCTKTLPLKSCLPASYLAQIADQTCLPHHDSCVLCISTWHCVATTAEQ